MFRSLGSLARGKGLLVGSKRVRLAGRGVQPASIAIAVIAAALCSASQAAAMTACEAIKPTIEHVGLVEVTPAGVVLEAQINPQNSATTYEFVIVQRVRNPSESGERTPEGPRALGGPIPAGSGEVTVSGLITGLQPGYIYWYEVIASNLAGETRSGSDNTYTFYYYTSGYPNLIGGTPYEATPPSGCQLEILQQKADGYALEAEAKRHQLVLEHEEQLAKEDAARYASEAAALRLREEEEAKAEAASRLSSCIVPALKGDTLRAARRAIEKAHCRLGEVREPHRHRGTLVVVNQSRRHGAKLAGGTVIVLTMGAARSTHRRAG